MTNPSHGRERVLVLGAKGMLGQELIPALLRRCGGKADADVLGWDIEELDIRDRNAVSDAIGETRPDIVVNAAAYTDVDGCETNLEMASDVNGEAPGHVAAACRKVGATLVHFGTDFVFDGQSTHPYRPDDPPHPLSAYGRSKLAGELAIQATGCNAIIIRTSWLFGPAGWSFVKAILDRAAGPEPLRVVTDQVGCPTLATDLAEAVVNLLDAGAAGTFHFTNEGECSWFEFAREILRQAGIDRPVERITSEQLDRPARRPAYSALDKTNYLQTTGAQIAPWQDALRRYLAIELRSVRPS